MILMGQVDPEKKMSLKKRIFFLRVQRDFAFVPLTLSYGIKQGLNPSLSTSGMMAVFTGCILSFRRSISSLSIRNASAPPFGNRTSDIRFIIL